MSKKVLVSPRNPFEKHQKAKVEGRVKIICDYLMVLKRTRAKYEYVTDLSKAVAAQVSLVENRKCDYSTILRNDIYKQFLLNFMMGIYPGDSPTKLSAGGGVEMKLLQSNLALGNSESENARLRAYILELEQKVGTAVQAASGTVLTAPVSDEQLLLENELGLANKALWLVLEHCKDFIAIDREGGRIIDLAALRHKNTIVSGADIEPFFKWLRKNSNIG